MYVTFVNSHDTPLVNNNAFLNVENIFLQFEHPLTFMFKRLPLH